MGHVPELTGTRVSKTLVVHMRLSIAISIIAQKKYKRIDKTFHGRRQSDVLFRWI